MDFLLKDNDMKLVKIKSAKFKLPKLKLKTDDTSNIGIIDIGEKVHF